MARVDSRWLFVASSCLIGMLPCGRIAAKEPLGETRTAPTRMTNVIAGESSAQSRARIEAALGEPTSFEFVDSNLAMIIRYLADKHHIPIVLDMRALANAGIEQDTPITAAFEGIPLRSGMKHLLRDLELTYVLFGDVLLATTLTEAESLLETRVYPVEDLLPHNSDAKARDDALQELRQLVVDNCAPKSWGDVGGFANISIAKGRPALVVSQILENHEWIADLMGMLRTAERPQSSVSSPARATSPSADDYRQFAAAYLRNFDRNGDGGLDAEEGSSFPYLPDWKRHDRDGDGLLSAEELADGLTNGR